MFEHVYIYLCIVTKDISSRVVVSYSFGVKPPKIGPLKTPLIIYNQTVERMEDHVHDMIEETNVCTLRKAPISEKIKTMFKGKLRSQKHYAIQQKNKKMTGEWHSNEENRLIRQVLMTNLKSECQK